MLVPVSSIPDLTKPANPPVSPQEIEQMSALADAIVVSDTASSIQAQECARLVKTAKKAVENWGKPAKDALNTAKNELMAYLKTFSDPLEKSEATLTRKVVAYNAEVKRQNEEAARAAAAAVEVAAPWEKEEAAAAPIPVTATPIVAGISTRKKPAEARIEDPVALLRWILEDPGFRIPEYVEFKQPALNAKARALGREVERLIPGVKYVQEETLSGR